MIPSLGIFKQKLLTKSICSKVKLNSSNITSTMVAFIFNNSMNA